MDDLDNGSRLTLSNKDTLCTAIVCSEKRPGSACLLMKQVFFHNFQNTSYEGLSTL